MFDHLNAALGDRYTVERELGRGGMASVWLARDRHLDRAVAITRTPLSVDSVPFPSLRPPCQAAEALRCISEFLLRLFSGQPATITPRPRQFAV